MSTPIILALLGFWLFLAFRSLQQGDVTRAAVLTLIGVGLTVWRFSRTRGGTR